MSRTSTRSVTFTLVAAALILGSVAAFAAGTAAPRAAKPATHKAAKSATVARPATAGQAGMRIYKDPETGQISGHASLPAIGTDGLPVVDDNPTDLPQVRLADGSYMIDLQGYFQDYAIIRLDAQGHRVMSCTPQPRTALKGRLPVVAPLAEK
jgi:hypothetical protein